MTSYLTTQTYDELYTQLVEARAWFTDLGLSTSGNRFGAIVSNVDLVRQHYDKPSFEDDLHEHSMHELQMSLLDAGSFVTVADQLRDLRSDQLPRRRLGESLGGPLMPHDEKNDGGTIQARNALFELELASRLQARGLKLQRFDDIEFEFRGVEVNVQCKRLHSPNALQHNLDAACAQLARRIAGTQKRGLVAIGIDKILQTDRHVMTAQNESDLKASAEARMNRFLRESEQRFMAIVDIRVLGLFIDMRFIGDVGDRNNLLVRGFETAIYPLASAKTLQFEDAGFMWLLGKQIADSVEQLR